MAETDRCDLVSESGENLYACAANGEIRTQTARKTQSRQQSGVKMAVSRPDWRDGHVRRSAADN